MATGTVTLISEPVKTVNGILSNVNAGRTQLPYIFTTTGQEAEENFKVNVDVLDENDTVLIPITFQYSPTNDGNLFLDISELIVELHEFGRVLAVQFKIEYFVTHTDFIGTKTKSALAQSIYAERQLLNEGGSSMAAFLADVTVPGQQLTRFEEPLVWLGFSRQSSIVVDSNLLSRVGAFSFISEYLDSNKDLISIANTVPVPNTVGIHFFDLENIFISPPAGVAFIRTKYLEDAGSAPVFQQLDYKVGFQCTEQIDLGWINNLSGIEDHIFVINQVVEVESEAGITAERAITEDIENITGTKIRVADKWTQRITLLAEGITRDVLKGLLQIKQSSSVSIALNRATSKFISVVVVRNLTTTYETGDNTYDFQVTVELPENFDVLEVIDYQVIQEGNIATEDDFDIYKGLKNKGLVD